MGLNELRGYVRAYATGVVAAEVAALVSQEPRLRQCPADLAALATERLVDMLVADLGCAEQSPQRRAA